MDVETTQMGTDCVPMKDVMDSKRWSPSNILRHPAHQKVLSGLQASEYLTEKQILFCSSLLGKKKSRERLE